MKDTSPVKETVLWHKLAQSKLPTKQLSNHTCTYVQHSWPSIHSSVSYAEGGLQRINSQLKFPPLPPPSPPEAYSLVLHTFQPQSPQVPPLSSSLKEKHLCSNHCSMYTMPCRIMDCNFFFVVLPSGLHCHTVHVCVPCKQYTASTVPRFPVFVNVMWGNSRITLKNTGRPGNEVKQHTHTSVVQHKHSFIPVFCATIDR